MAGRGRDLTGSHGRASREFADIGRAGLGVAPATSERPHPGAQLRFDDVDGMRITAFVTNNSRGQLPDLELRHRRRARCEDRIRMANSPVSVNLPLYSFAANQIW